MRPCRSPYHNLLRRQQPAMSAAKWGIMLLIVLDDDRSGMLHGIGVFLLQPERLPRITPMDMGSLAPDHPLEAAEHRLGRELEATLPAPMAIMVSHLGPTELKVEGETCQADVMMDDLLCRLPSCSAASLTSSSFPSPRSSPRASRPAAVAAAIATSTT